MKRLTILPLILIGLNYFGQIYQDFENSNPITWNQIDNDSYNDNSWNDASSGYKSENCKSVNWSLYHTNDWIITNSLYITANDTLFFHIKQSYINDYNSKLKINISTSSQTDISTYVTIDSLSESSFGIDWQLKYISLSAYSGQNIYIAFEYIQEDGDDIFLDNIFVGKNYCETKNIVYSDIYDGVNNLYYTVNNLEINTLDFRLFDQQNNSYTIHLDKDTIDNIDQIFQNNHYKIELRNYCSNSTNPSFYQYIKSMFTSFENDMPPLIEVSTVFTTPFTENFDTYNANSQVEHWTVLDYSGIEKFKIGYNINNNTNSYSLLGEVLYDKNDWLISPNLLLKNDSTYYLSFDFSSSNNNIEKIKVHLINKLDSSISDTIIYLNTNLQSNTVNHISYEFTPFISDTFLLAIHMFSDANQGVINIDNVKITTDKECEAIDTIYLQEFGVDSAIFYWNMKQADNYHISYGKHNNSNIELFDTIITDSFLVVRNFNYDQLIQFNASSVCNNIITDFSYIQYNTPCVIVDNLDTNYKLFKEDFEKEAAGDTKFCFWSYHNADANTRSFEVNNYYNDFSQNSRNGNASAIIASDFNQKKNDMLISSPIFINSEQLFTFSYDIFVNPNYMENYAVYISKNPFISGSNEIKIDEKTNWNTDFSTQIYENLKVPNSNYYYIIFWAKSNSNSDYISIDNISIEVTGSIGVEENDSDKFDIYPKPSTNKFYINTDINEEYNVTIYDLAGKIVYEKQNNIGKIELATNLKSGIYNINIYSENHINNQKLVIQ